MRDYVQKRINPNRWLERLTVRQLAGLVLMMVVLSGFLFLLDGGLNRNVVYAPQETAVFAPLLTLEDVTLTGPPKIVEDTAVVIAALSPNELPTLQALNLTTGEVDWFIPIDAQSRPDWWLDELEWNYPFRWLWGEIEVDETAVYVTDRFLLTTSITAYALESGEELWQRQIGVLNGSPVRELQLVDGKLGAHIVDGAFATLTIFDPANGFELYEESANGASLFWAERFEDSERQYREYPSGLEATEVNPWTFPLENCGLTPTLQQSRIVVRASFCDESGRAGVLALDRVSGAELWRLTVPIVSNVALDGEVGYAITYENQLIGFDLSSGAVLEILNFDRPLGTIDPEMPIFVGAGGGVTAVYYDETNQLFFFSSPFQ